MDGERCAQSNALGWAELRESVAAGQRELLRRLRTVLGVVEASSARLTAHSQELAAVRARLEDVDESLKVLARSLQQPGGPQEVVAGLHELLQAETASPGRLGRKLHKARRGEARARSATDSARRSAEKPAKVAGRRGRRSQAAAVALPTEPEHPNLYTALGEGQVPNSSAAWPHPEAKNEPAAVPLFAEEAPLATAATADTQPDPPAPVSPSPREGAVLLEGRAREIEFAEAPQGLLAAARTASPGVGSHPRTLFAQQGEKRDFF